MRTHRLRCPDVWLACVAAVAGVVLLSGVATPVQFVSERIQVCAGAGWIDVDGSYEYHNRGPWPTALRLEVPFPVDAAHPEPSSLALDELDEHGLCRRRLVPTVVDGQVSVRFFFWPGEVRRLRVRYGQRALVANGRYIVTTTREWGRPLRWAVLELTLRPGATLVRSSFPVLSIGDGQRYRLQQRDFWPEQDWEFTWHDEEAS